MMIADFFGALFADIKSFFSASLGFGGPLVTGQIVVWALIIGFVVAAIACIYNRYVLGSFVSYLIKNSAHTPESAISPTNAFAKNFFLKSALRSGGLFGKLVTCSNEPAEAKDVLQKRYYIANENKARAERMYSRNGASIVGLLVALVLLIILAAVIYIVLPELISMTESFANAVMPDSNIA